MSLKIICISHFFLVVILWVFAVISSYTAEPHSVTPVRLSQEPAVDLARAAGWTSRPQALWHGSTLWLMASCLLAAYLPVITLACIISFLKLQIMMLCNISWGRRSLSGTLAGSNDVVSDGAQDPREKKICRLKHFTPTTFIGLQNELRLA